MNKTLFFLLAIITSINTWAQDTRTDILKENAKKIAKTAADTNSKSWLTGGVLNLNASQSSLSNWAAGGDDFALSINALINFYGYYKKGKHSWDNTLNLNFGYIRTTTLNGRKNDDRIDLMSRYGYAFNPNWDFGGLFNFRTQALKGYSYNKDGTKTKNSNFLAPAYISVGPGITYSPEGYEKFSAYISPVSARWIIVKDPDLNALGLYGVDSGETVKTQLGAYLTVYYQHNLTKTLSYTGRLDLFSDYLDKPQNVYVYMTNLFALKISKVLSATWNFNLIYDDKAKLFGPNEDAPRLQTQSVVGVGLLYKFDNKVKKD